MRNACLAAVQDTFWQASEQLLFHHTNPWELDEALVAFGFAMGPCEAQDIVGLDVVLARQSTPASPVLSRMVSEGRMGKKGGVGFYRYPGRGGAVIDPLIEDLIREEAWFAKSERVELCDGALVLRLIAALREVALGLQGRGIAASEVDQLLGQAVHFPVLKSELIWEGT
jgi:3-hydroxyacyl-CoA dehydrogenase